MEYAEPIAIPDVFAMGIAKLDLLGSCARVSFFVEEDGGRVIVARVVMPIEAWPPEWSEHLREAQAESARGRKAVKPEVH